MLTFPHTIAGQIRDFASRNDLGTIAVEVAGDRCFVCGERDAVILIKLTFA